MGRERGNTFNQGTDGELIECVEKSGFCDHIAFPPLSLRSPRLLQREHPAPLQPCPFTRCFPRNLRAPERRVVGVGWRLLPVEPTPPSSTGPPVPRPPPHRLAPLSTQSQQRLGSEGTHGLIAESSAWLASEMPLAPCLLVACRKETGLMYPLNPLPAAKFTDPQHPHPAFLRRYRGAMRRRLKTLRLWLSSGVTAPRGCLAVSGDVTGGRDSGRMLSTISGRGQQCG